MMVSLPRGAHSCRPEWPPNAYQSMACTAGICKAGCWDACGGTPAAKQVARTLARLQMMKAISVSMEVGPMYSRLGSAYLGITLRLLTATSLPKYHLLVVCRTASLSSGSMLLRHHQESPHQLLRQMHRKDMAPYAR